MLLDPSTARTSAEGMSPTRAPPLVAPSQVAGPSGRCLTSSNSVRCSAYRWVGGGASVVVVGGGAVAVVVEGDVSLSAKALRQALWSRVPHLPRLLFVIARAATRDAGHDRSDDDETHQDHSRVEGSGEAVGGRVSLAPSAGFEPAHMAPEATALSPELRGLNARTAVRACCGVKRTDLRRGLLWQRCSAG